VLSLDAIQACCKNRYLYERDTCMLPVFFRGFIMGESVSFMEAEGVWERYCPDVSHFKARELFSAASAAAQKAYAVTAGGRGVHSDLLIDVLRGVAESSGSSYEVDRARSVLKNTRMVGSSAYIATLQRRYFKEHGISHSDAVLLMREENGVAKEFVLAEIRPGAIPDDFQSFPVFIDPGSPIRLSFCPAPPARTLDGCADSEIFRREDHTFGHRDLSGSEPACATRFGSCEEAVYDAIDQALLRNIRTLRLTGGWIHDGAVEYGLVYGMAVLYPSLQSA
jgi:hypothetical protein